MSAAIDFIQYGERMVGEASPDYSDTLNRALKTVVTLSAGDEDNFGGFALRPAVDATANQFYRATGTGAAATWVTLVTAMISDLTTAATGITKVGTVNTGVWQGTSIATTYTDAKVKTVTGTANRLDIGGTATDPTFDISATYVGQASITTLGTIATGAWQGTSIGTAYTDAKVVSISGVSNRTSVGGTATVPIVDISATYVGQSSITTVGTIATGVWQGTSIATGFTDAKIKTVTGTLGTVTISGTATDPIFTISAAYIGQNTITTLGTITTGVWNGTAISTTFTSAQVIDVTGTASRITIGGTATHPTVDIAAAYIGQSSITTLGTVTTGTWQGTSIATGFTDAKVKTVTGTTNRLTIGGTATDPTFDISVAYVGQATITTLGTVATGTWAATTISPDHGGTGLTGYAVGDMIYASGATTIAKFPIGSAAQILVTNGAATAPAWHTLVTADITDLTSAATGITKVGTVTTGIWNAGVIPGQYGGTGVNNGASTITLGGNLTTSGAFALTLTLTAGTNVTLPTTGTLVNSAVTSLVSLTSVGGAFAISGAFTGATTGAFSSTLSTSQLTITDTASRIIPGATSLSLRNNANSADNVLVSDAGAVTIRAGVAATTASFSGALTYGGVTLSNAVTGTGNMVLSASPTFTGTITAAAITSALVTSQGATGGFQVTRRDTNAAVMLMYATGDTTMRWSNGGSDVMTLSNAGALGLAAGLTCTTGTFSGAVTGITSISAGGGNFTVSTIGAVIAGNGLSLGNSAITNVTGFSLSGSITSSSGNSSRVLQNIATATTGYLLIDLANTSGRMFLGIEGSAGSEIIPGASAYATVIGSQSNRALAFGTNNTRVGGFSSTGTFDVGGTFTVTSAGVTTVGNHAASTNGEVDLDGATTSGFGAILNFYRGGVRKAAIGTDSCVNGNNSDDLYLYSFSNATINASTGFTVRLAINGSVAMSAAGTEVNVAVGFTVGSPTGGVKGTGTINIAGDIYKNNTAYTNPDYVFELAYTGSITKFAENAGAAKFVERGIMSLDQIEDFARKTWQLPGVAEAEGIFERADVVLEKIEEAYLHLFDLHKRLKKIEAAAV